MEHVDLGGKTANLKAAYEDLKLGYDIIVGHLRMYIYICERRGSPSYGKEYIYYNGYGSWSSTVNFKEFADHIRKEHDYKGNYDYSREYD